MDQTSAGRAREPRSATLIVLALLVGGCLLWEFVPLQVTVWDGGFDLSVTITSLPSDPIRTVTCQAVGRREEAEYILKYLRPETDLWSATADPFTGRPVLVHVPLSGRDSPLGRELNRFQFRYLVVIAEFQGGKRSGKLVEIPDSRVSRSVEVSFP